MTNLKYSNFNSYQNTLVACYTSFVSLIDLDSFSQRQRFDFKEVLIGEKDEHITDFLILETSNKCIVATSL